jgi:hypothetical protein
MMAGYVAQCAVRGIRLDRLEIETDGTIDLRGFLDSIPPCCRLRVPAIHGPHQAQRQHRAVRRDPPGRDGDVAQNRQRRGPWTSIRRSSSNDRALRAASLS